MSRIQSRSTVSTNTYSNSVGVNYTRTGIAERQDQVNEINNDIYLKKILDEFVLPFRKGEFQGIDPYIKFDTYLEALKQTKAGNMCHNLAVESMAAALNAKGIYFNFKIQKHKASVQSKEINELELELDALNRKLREYDDAFLTSNMGVCIQATASVDTFNLLPYLAKKNIYLGWYYYFNAYDVAVGIDPDEYLRIKKLVDSMGTENLPGRNYSNALRILLITIRQDEIAAASN